MRTIHVKCHHCNSEYDVAAEKESVFCMYCGATITATEESKKEHTYNRKPTQTLALRCSVCGCLHDKKLTTENPDSYFGAKIAAYPQGICSFSEIPTPGAEMEITVFSPFYCDIGDTFWTAYFNRQYGWGKEHIYRYAQAQLLSIVDTHLTYATILVRVLQVRDWLSFVKPVPQALKQRLKESGSYRFDEPGGQRGGSGLRT